ncbi:hypothetical protein GH733_014784, partial [Mirounga leonina]
MWIKFSSDEELEGLGFQTKYSSIPDLDFIYLRGADGIVFSSQGEQEEKTKPGETIDCIWTFKAIPKTKVYLKFLDYQMEHSNECKRNFIAVYDGSSSTENLKTKFCSTLANDVMLKTGVGVIQMWAEEVVHLSRFRMFFTSFVEPPCTVQVQQPQKKVMACKTAFNKTVFQEASNAHECPQQALEDRVMEEIPCEIY